MNSLKGFYVFYVQQKQGNNSSLEKKELEVGAETPRYQNANANKEIGGIDDDNEENENEEADEEEESEEVQEILALPKEERQCAFVKSAFYGMTSGVFIVLFFSDPMVNILNELGTRTGIPTFFVAFTLAPLASNASELIASIKYAMKKDKSKTDIAFSQLLGAANMNNTFCLSIFLALICFRPLVWTFTAESIVIVLIEYVMLGMAFKTTHTLLDALTVISLYPLSIVFVYILEYQVGLN